VTLWTGATIVLLVAIALVCLLSRDPLPSEWFSSESSDGQHTVSARLIGEAGTFGPQSIGVYANHRLLFSTEISHDGKTLNESNYEVVWMGREATLTLSGEEQKDAAFRIVFESGGVSYSEIS
jgi:hypothetical protein